MLDRLLDEFLMESYQNYSDYQNAYSAHFDTLFRAYEVMKESVDDIDMYQAKMCAQESANDIMGKIKAFFKTLIEKIKQFIKDIKTAVKSKFQQIQLQRKLTEIKKLLIENRNDREVSTKKVEIFDALKYNAMYNKYIAMIQKEIQALSTTKFKDVEDLNKQINEVSSHITSYAEKLGLTSYEKYKIQVGIMDAMKVAEQSITIYDKQYTVSGDNWVSCVTNAEKVCTTDKNVIAVDRLATLTQKFSNKCSELFDIMAKHPVKSIAIILGAVTSISVIAYGMSSKNMFNKMDNAHKSTIKAANETNEYNSNRLKKAYQDNKELFDVLKHFRQRAAEEEFGYRHAAKLYDSAINKHARDHVDNPLDYEETLKKANELKKKIYHDFMYNELND